MWKTLDMESLLGGRRYELNEQSRDHASLDPTSEPGNLRELSEQLVHWRLDRR